MGRTTTHRATSATTMSTATSIALMASSTDVTGAVVAGHRQAEVGGWVVRCGWVTRTGRFIKSLVISWDLPVSPSSTLSSGDRVITAMSDIKRPESAPPYFSPRVALPNHTVRAMTALRAIEVLPRPSRATPPPEEKAWMQMLARESKVSMGATRLVMKDFEQKLGPLWAAAPNLKNWMKAKGVDMDAVMLDIVRYVIIDMKQNMNAAEAQVGSQHLLEKEWMCEQLAQQITNNQELKMQIALMEREETQVPSMHAIYRVLWWRM